MNNQLMLPPNQSMLMISSGKEEDYPVLTISNENSVLFGIDREGNIFYTLDGILKKMESEKELGLIFSLAISGLSGIKYPISKEEIITKIIKNYREGKIDDLLNIID